MADMSLTLEGDMEEAFRLVQEATHRSMMEICNGFARDVCLWAIKFTRQAAVAKVRALESLDWWPKYIAKRLSHGTITLPTKTRQFLKPGQAAPLHQDTPTGKFVPYKVFVARSSSKKFNASSYRRFIKAAGRKTVGGGHYTRAEARAASRRIINARIRSINFLRAGFIPAARAFAAATGRENLKVIAWGDSSGNRYDTGVAKGGFKLATERDHPVAEIRNTAVGRKSHTPGAGLERYAAVGLKQAIEEVSRRNIEWATGKLQKEFNKVSAEVVSELAG